MRRALVAAVVGGFAIAAAPALAGNNASFGDVTGDARADITSVVVSNDDFGSLYFRFEVPGATSLPADARYAIVIDADRRSETGDSTGGDYLIEVDGAQGAARVARWNNGTYATAPSTLRVNFVRGGLELRLQASDIGNPQSFEFFAASDRTASSGSLDRAPDAGRWSFEIKYTPLLIEGEGYFTPLAPRAGREFRLRRFGITTSLNQNVFAGTFRCQATLDGRPFAPLRGSTCRWRLPARSRGLRLRIFVNATYGGTNENFDPFEFRVRGR